MEVVDSLNTLTGDLLLLARGESAALSSSFSDISLAAVARAAVDQQVAHRPRPPVSVEVARDVAVRGSPELLIRAIGNIVDNALKFTPASGRVELSVREDGGAAVVHVRDTGSGMDDDTAVHAFDRFWRADEARTQPGYGLGLSLVQQICSAHGGTVTISGRPGVGTSVRLTFPAVR